MSYYTRNTIEKTSIARLQSRRTADMCANWPPPDQPQKSDTRPLKLQSPPSSVHRLTGSLLGPPLSPVFGLISPSNSGSRGLRASGCNKSSSAIDGAEVGRDDGWLRGACARRTSSSNSRWSAAGRGGGDGRGRSKGAREDIERRGCCSRDRTAGVEDEA